MIPAGFGRPRVGASVRRILAGGFGRAGDGAGVRETVAGGFGRAGDGAGVRPLLAGLSQWVRPGRRARRLERSGQPAPDAARRAGPRIRNPEHVFLARTTLPIPIDRVFAFFSAAENLERITPPELSFRIETAGPIKLERGARIDYRLSLFRVPFRWQTEITTWVPPSEFVDTQLRGPYGQWIHRHRFHEVDGETVMEDEVRYRLPLPILGELARPLVRLQIARIFGYRERRIRELLALPAVVQAQARTRASH